MDFTECKTCGTSFEAKPGKLYHSRECQLIGRSQTSTPIKDPLPDISTSQSNDSMSHVWIPDTQARPGVRHTHMSWIGQYIVDKFSGKPVTIIGGGDHHDMPSLSSYDKGKSGLMEGRRYAKDIEAGNKSWRLLSDPIATEERRLRGEWQPKKIKLRGNHENRITRAVESDAVVDGLMSLNDIDDGGFEAIPFLVPITLDGIMYAHYFYNPMTGRPYAGQNLETRLKTIGHSFTMGHQQGLKWGRVDTLTGPNIGLVAGSCYLHSEEYIGPQGNDHWRGIIVKHQVEKGSYDPMMVSLDYLCRRYEGVRLSRFLTRHYS